MASGIKDKVAILGMGCSKFGERWDKEADDLMVEAYEEALGDAGIETKQIDAAWLATAIEEQHVGKSGMPLAMALRLPYIPVTRVENYCASGTEAFRGAVYAVASGAADIALAMGCEKLKDTGYGGLPQRCARRAELHVLGQLLRARRLRPARRRLSRQAPRSSRGPQARHGAHLGQEPRQRRQESQGASAQQDQHRHRAAARRSSPSRSASTTAAACRTAPPAPSSPRPRSPAASARPTSSRSRRCSSAVSNGQEAQHNSWDGSHFVTTRIASKRAYQEAGIRDPRTDISLIEVHDCFSVTELVTMEDLYISKEGEAVKDVLDGFYDADGALPCQIDGGLKCFGHPIGASGLRMIYEIYLQMQGRAGERQRQDATLRPHPQSRRLPAPERLLHLHHRPARGISHVLLPARCALQITVF